MKRQIGITGIATSMSVLSLAAGLICGIGKVWLYQCVLWAFAGIGMIEVCAACVCVSLFLIFMLLLPVLLLLPPSLVLQVAASGIALINYPKYRNR